MAQAAAPTGMDEALDHIQASILPNLSLTLDALLEAAQARSGTGRAAHAAELRAIAVQLADIVRQAEQATALAQPPIEWPIRMSA